MQPHETYELTLKQLQALIEQETDEVALMANASACLKQALTDVNWLGFYRMHNHELVLGPFQGLPACVRIPLGAGVCGTAAIRQTTLCVDDVHAFPGHIACDAASRSEIVIPLMVDGAVYGVLDVDAPIPARFQAQEQQFLLAAATQIANRLQQALHQTR